MTVYALVVTYNRKALLIECLNAILAQSRMPDKIVVIDNASTDGTRELFSKGGAFDDQIFRYVKMEKNTGGAGGFYEGIKQTYSECDYIWLMDDDTIPNPHTLEGLCNSVNQIGDKASFFASIVFGPEGEPMNLPVVDISATKNGYADWYFSLDKQMVKIKSATFVSLLINTVAVKSVGLPLDWYFIWGDDTEYTLRLTKYYGPAYFTAQSSVLHKRFNVKNLSIRDEENKNRIKMYFYFYRNMLINKEIYESKRSATRFRREGLKECVRILVKPNIKYRMSKVNMILKGISAYTFGKYDRKAFDSRLKNLSEESHES